jgi:hypothetical protein
MADHGSRKRIGNGWIWMLVVLAAIVAWWVFNIGIGGGTT